MRYLWDLFRWRFVAAYYIIWWGFKGFPVRDLPSPSRWENLGWAWHQNRSIIMYRHEKHKYITVEEWLDSI